MLTKKQLLAEDYEVTQNLKDSFYILTDGELWEAGIDCGIRSLDHREVEAFTDLNRYDGTEFWEEVFLKLKLIMVIPETQQLMIHPKQKFTDKQVEMLAMAVNQGYEVILFD